MMAQVTQVIHYAVDDKSHLTIAQEQLDAADGTSNAERAALLTQAAQVHVLMEVAKQLAALNEEVTNIRRTQERQGL
jgi:hypothetical protein